MSGGEWRVREGALLARDEAAGRRASAAREASRAVLADTGA
jgi:hypothetical protein